jgi:hypothetical protein
VLAGATDVAAGILVAKKAAQAAKAAAEAAHRAKESAEKVRGAYSVFGVLTVNIFIKITASVA